MHMTDESLSPAEPAAPEATYRLHRPAKLIRTAFDLEDHARKARWLGITPEDHARFTHLILRREARPDDFRGLTGDSLAARVKEIWESGRRNA